MCLFFYLRSQHGLAGDSRRSAHLSRSQRSSKSHLEVPRAPNTDLHLFILLRGEQQQKKKSRNAQSWKSNSKHPSHSNTAQSQAQESTWRTKVSQTFPQPTAESGKRRERREKKMHPNPTQTNSNQLRKWRRKDAKEQ